MHDAAVFSCENGASISLTGTGAVPGNAHGDDSDESHPHAGKHVSVRVWHHDVEGVARPDLLTADDERDVDHLGGLCLELGLELSSLSTAWGVGEDGFVDRRWRGGDAVH